MRVAAVQPMSVSDRMAALKQEGKTALIPFIVAGTASCSPCHMRHVTVYKCTTSKRSKAIMRGS